MRNGAIYLVVKDFEKSVQFYEKILDMKVSAIRYLEYVSPYWYFTFMDPDGNPIEITGGMKSI